MKDSVRKDSVKDFEQRQRKRQKNLPSNFYLKVKELKSGGFT